MDEPRIVFMLAVPVPPNVADAAALLNFLTPPCWSFIPSGDALDVRHIGGDDCGPGASYVWSLEKAQGFVTELSATGKAFARGVRLIGMGVEVPGDDDDEPAPVQA